jgi:hypothetical protein
VVVVVMPEVTVVRRWVVVVARDVGAGAGVASLAVVDALGLSGATAFCTCVDANAVMPASEETVIAVATARSTVTERMSGDAVFACRPVTGIGEHARRGGS